MKQLLLEYAHYNIWANDLIINALLKLSPEQADQEVNSSFNSIRKTVLHVWGAEDVWMQRIELAEHPVWQPATFTGSFEDACANWRQASKKLEAFITTQDDQHGMPHVLEYYDMKGNHHKTPVYQVLQHVFNHSTYHRGQLVTMLRQVGATEVPGTDFIAFARLPR